MRNTEQITFYYVKIVKLLVLGHCKDCAVSTHILRSPWTRLSLDDPALHNLIEKIDAMMKEFGHATVLNVLPSIRQGF